MVCMHIGSSSTQVITCSDAPIDTLITLQPMNIVQAAADLVWSRMVHESLEAADELAGEGIEAEVIDLRCLDPLDWDTVLASVSRTRRCVVAEEGWRKVGVGAEIGSRLHETLFYELDAPVQRVGAADVPTPYAKGLEQDALPDAADIVQAALKITT